MTEHQPHWAEPTASIPEPPRELALEFHGSARDYFRIWAVNLFLTLLTLGIFSAWAKVRKKRYFYSHTTLDGTPFQYLGQPIPILKGRIIAAVLFLLYFTSSNFITIILPYVLIVGLVLAPWVIVRSAAFNASYSAWRNMTFHFDGKYWDALKAIYWLGLIPALIVGAIFNWWGNLYVTAAAYAAFGLVFPWWICRFKKYVVNHMSFGGEHGELSVTGGQFFKIYFLAGLIVVLAGIIAGVFMLLASVSTSKKPDTMTLLFISLPIYAGYVLAYAYVQAHSGNLVWNHTCLGPLRFRSTLTSGSLAKLYLGNALAIIASVGLLTPWAVIRTLKYRADNMRVRLHGDFGDFVGEEASTVRATGAELGEFFDLDVSL